MLMSSLKKLWLYQDLDIVSINCLIFDKWWIADAYQSFLCDFHLYENT